MLSTDYCKNGGVYTSIANYSCGLMSTDEENIYILCGSSLVWHTLLSPVKAVTMKVEKFSKKLYTL